MNLKRTLGLFPATNIVIANMVGAGIFTTSGLLLAELHNPVLMISLWVIGGLIALCGAMVYGELGASMPEPGGEYLFLSRIFHPIFGFLSGWISFLVGFSAPIAASAIGFSEYFIRAFPNLSGYFLETFNISPTVLGKIFSVTVVLVFTIIHIRGIEFGAKVQNVLTILKVVLVVGLITTIMFSGKGSANNFNTDASSAHINVSLKTIALSLMWIMFAYSGWNASTYIGSEIKNPSRNLPFSLIIGTGIVMLLYIMLNVAFVYSTAPEKIKGVISVGGMAMGSVLGQSADRFFSLLISFALFSSLSAFMIIGPRVYYSMARDGLFFKSVAKVNPSNVPAVSIVLQALMAVIFIVSGTFEQILTYMGFSLGIFPILTVIGSARLRMRGSIKVKLSGFPISHAIYLLTGISILVLSFMERPKESSVALLTLGVGVPAFYIFRYYNR